MSVISPLTDQSPRAPRWWEPPVGDDEDAKPVVVRLDASCWKQLLKLVGPGIMIAIAYIDPGNYSTDLMAGSRFQFRLLWSVLFAHVLGYVFQVLVVLLSAATGRTLSEECALEYPRLRIFLWLSAEVSSVASDLGYVMGTATAFVILFGWDIQWCVLLASCDTLLFMGIQALGHRPMELFCGLLGGVVLSCCLFEIAKAGWDNRIFSGLLPFYGGLSDGVEQTTPAEDRSAYLFILTSVIGASVCPPNYFLHSALVHTRQFEEGEDVDDRDTPEARSRQLRICVFFNALETGVGISFAFVINAIILIVAGYYKYDPVNPEQMDDLGEAADMLQTGLGKLSGTVFALSILFGGQSASVSGTLASQYIMEGFLNVRLKLWLRRLLTRAVSIVPAFLITLANPDKSADIINYAQVVVNFVVPFTLIPILKFTTSELKMGQHKVGRASAVVLWLLMLFVTGLNLALGFQILFSLGAPLWLEVGLVVLLLPPYAAVVVYLVWKKPSAECRTVAELPSCTAGP